MSSRTPQGQAIAGATFALNARIGKTRPRALAPLPPRAEAANDARLPSSRVASPSMTLSSIPTTWMRFVRRLAAARRTSCSRHAFAWPQRHHRRLA